MISQKINLPGPSVRNRYWAILMVIILAALALRLYKLDLMPLNHDERWLAVEGVDLIKGGGCDYVFGVPVSFYAGKEIVLFYLFNLLASFFFIDPVLIARIPSVLFGVLAVLVTYSAGSRLYERRSVGLLSALFMAFLPWHIIMSRVGFKAIMVPFFGVSIFYLLYAGIKYRRKGLFLLSFPVLALGAFYTYPSAWAFIPVFALALVILKNRYGLPGRMVFPQGILLFLIFLVPLAALAMQVNFFRSQSYHSIFRVISPGVPDAWDIFFNNFVINLKVGFRILFFPDTPPIGLFAPTITSPLMISRWFFPLFLGSVIYALRRRTAADLIVLIWLSAAFLGPCLFSKDGIGARYFLTALPAILIVVARFLADMYYNPAVSRLLKVTALAVTALIVIVSSLIMSGYYSRAGGNRGEWLMNSFGSKEAARYLFEDNTNRDYIVISDFRMTIAPYLKYYIRLFKRKKEIFGKPSEHFGNYNAERFGVLYFSRPGGPVKDILRLERELLRDNEVIYYFLWSPKTHTYSKVPFLERFSRLSSVFRKCHPEARTVKEILYPDGEPAIEVYKIYR